MKKSVVIIVILILLQLLSACKTPSVTQTQALVPTSEQTAGYPAPQTPIPEKPNYPAPETQQVSTTAPTNTPDPNMGSVHGKLLLNGQPVPSIKLDLAEVLTDQAGRDIVSALDRSKSPAAFTDDQGIFYFINVPPGKYTLILDTITNQHLLNYPGKEDVILLQIEAGKEIDLGNLNFDELPLPKP